MKMLKDTKAPPFKIRKLSSLQSLSYVIPRCYVRAILNDLDSLRVFAKLLEVHDAIHAIRMTADPDYTADDWRATLLEINYRYVNLIVLKVMLPTYYGHH